MRNLSLFVCVLALIVSSGCQSGGYGFRNPFKDQFARTFPNSIPELSTKSKDSGTENRGVFDLGGDASPGVQSVSDSEGSFGLSDREQFAEVETILDRGDAAYAAGNLLLATGHYQEALTHDPHNVHAHHRLAIIHDQQQDYTTAEQHYEAALNLQPENVDILNDLGYSYYLQERFEDSKAHLEYILQIKPDYHWAKRNLGLVHAAEGDLQHAFALLQQGGLSPEESRQQIQQAVARAGEQRSASRSGRMGIASTKSDPPGLSSINGFATVENDNVNDNRSTDSMPGRGGTQSPHGNTFQPRPDYDSSYGLSANQPARNPGPPIQPEVPASNSSTPAPYPKNTLAQRAHTENHAVERVSYNPPLQQYEASPSDEEIIRAALNTGYGNLFPVISPEDYYRMQRDIGVYHGGDARNAHYKEFGTQESSTPYVVHADSNQPAKSDISRNRMRNVSYQPPRPSSFGSPRIQSPSDRPDQQEPATPAVPANRFPVTESPGQSHYNPDYSRFPKTERPPFTESSGRTTLSGHSASGRSGTLNTPESADSSAASRFSPSPDVSHATANDHATPVAPMSDDARKAHELALERYRQMQQQQ